MVLIENQWILRISRFLLIQIWSVVFCTPRIGNLRDGVFNLLRETYHRCTRLRVYGRSTRKNILIQQLPTLLLHTS